MEHVGTALAETSLPAISPLGGEPIERADAERLAGVLKALADPGRLREQSLRSGPGRRRHLVDRRRYLAGPVGPAGLLPGAAERWCGGGGWRYQPTHHRAAVTPGHLPGPAGRLGGHPPASADRAAARRARRTDPPGHPRPPVLPPGHPHDAPPAPRPGCAGRDPRRRRGPPYQIRGAPPPR